jgi:hypothetical protein
MGQPKLAHSFLTSPSAPPASTKSSHPPRASNTIETYMAEIKEFVVNDRRKFTAEGELRPDAAPSEPRPPRDTTPEEFSSASHAQPKDMSPKGPQAVPAPVATSEPDAPTTEPQREDLPPPPTAEQLEQSLRAYQATVERIDLAIRAANPGMERIPEMTFDRLVQSVYMQAILQLGGGTEPGQAPQVDLLGARQSIDMLNVLSEKTVGNLATEDDNLLQSALFEARMGFLEVTQMLARQAAAKAGGTGMPPPPGSGPQIVR